MGNVSSCENPAVANPLTSNNKSEDNLTQPSSKAQFNMNTSNRTSYMRKLTQMNNTQKLQNSVQIISEGSPGSSFNPGRSTSTRTVLQEGKNSPFKENEEENFSNNIFENEDNQSCFPFRKIMSDTIKFPLKIEREFLEENIRMSRASQVTTTCEYMLDYVRSGEDLRKSYIQKLILKKVWTPNDKPKDHNTLIIFDWDDTLLPTTFLSPCGYYHEDLILNPSENEKIQKLEESVLQILEIAISKGDTYIITNAAPGWVEYSASRYYPKILNILKKIKVLSARGQYEKIFPGDSRQWKIETFLEMQKKFDCKLVTNLICLGDSIIEMEAAVILASKFSQAFIKTIKFREAPKPEELDKQLNLIKNQFNTIYSGVKNLTIRVERKPLR